MIGVTMKHLKLIIIMLLCLISWVLVYGVFAIFTTIAHANTLPTRDVTSTPLIAKDLQGAVKYWKGATNSSCSSVRVTVGPMVDGTGNDGVLIPASKIGAETGIGTCTIALARITYNSRHFEPHDFCIMIAHEYAHVIGYGDTATGDPMLEMDWVKRSAQVRDIWCNKHNAGK